MEDLELWVRTFGLFGVNCEHRFIAVLFQFDFFSIDVFDDLAMVVVDFDGRKVL